MGRKKKRKKFRKPEHELIIDRFKFSVIYCFACSMVFKALWLFKDFLLSIQSPNVFVSYLTSISLSADELENVMMSITIAIFTGILLLIIPGVKEKNIYYYNRQYIALEDCALAFDNYIKSYMDLKYCVFIKSTFNDCVEGRYEILREISSIYLGLYFALDKIAIEQVNDENLEKILEKLKLDCKDCVTEMYGFIDGSCLMLSLVDLEKYINQLEADQDKAQEMYKTIMQKKKECRFRIEKIYKTLETK